MSNNDEKYNGWTNRETWAVALHVNNDQGWQESVHDAIRDYLRSDAATDPDRTPEGLSISAGEIVRENVEDRLLDMAVYGTDFSTHRDIGSLWRVDWTELGASFLEDLES